MNDKKFAVWCPDQDEEEQDAREVWAYDHESAAAEWAEREDASSADYWIVGQGGTEVMVRAEGGETKRVAVGAEPTIHYSAREVAATPAADQKDGAEQEGGGE